MIEQKLTQNFTINNEISEFFTKSLEKSISSLFGHDVTNISVCQIAKSTNLSRYNTCSNLDVPEILNPLSRNVVVMKETPIGTFKIYHLSRFTINTEIFHYRKEDSCSNQTSCLSDRTSERSRSW